MRLRGEEVGWKEDAGANEGADQMILLISLFWSKAATGGISLQPVVPIDAGLEQAGMKELFADDRCRIGKEHYNPIRPKVAECVTLRFCVGRTMAVQVETKIFLHSLIKWRTGR